MINKKVFNNKSIKIKQQQYQEVHTDNEGIVNKNDECNSNNGTVKEVSRVFIICVNNERV